MYNGVLIGRWLYFVGHGIPVDLLFSVGLFCVRKCGGQVSILMGVELHNERTNLCSNMCQVVPLNLHVVGPVIPQNWGFMQYSNRCIKWLCFHGWRAVIHKNVVATGVPKGVAMQWVKTQCAPWCCNERWYVYLFAPVTWLMKSRHHSETTAGQIQRFTNIHCMCDNTYNSTYMRNNTSLPCLHLTYMVLYNCIKMGNKVLYYDVISNLKRNESEMLGPLWYATDFGLWVSNQLWNVSTWVWILVLLQMMVGLFEYCIYL